MVSDGEKFIEYAVEVQGRGFATWQGSLTAEAEYWVRDLDEANTLARDLQQRLMRLRCDDIMVAVRIVTREVTVERTDWRPLSEHLADASA